MKTGLRVKGNVVVRVLDEDGRVKVQPPAGRRSLFHTAKRRLMEQKFYHIFIWEWGVPIAGFLLSSVRYIRVGMGGTERSVKTDAGRNTAVVSMQEPDNGYPARKGTWDSGEKDIRIIYQATFPAGALNVKGINEVYLFGDNDSSDGCLVYARLRPVMNVTSGDTLQIVWEFTVNS
ncbi:MAG: hypothetical protein LBP81_08090 [Treponema sp.]|jgi:hypothetical protein|nr:hypothetical protein [Treponema sp.]